MNGGPLDEFGLTLKQHDFCLALEGEAKGNATEACRIARYDGEDNTLRSIASENLTKPAVIAFLKHIRAEKEASFSSKITERHMDAAEVRSNLSLLARTAEKHSDRIRATELMGRILGEFPNKIEVSSDELRDMIARANTQFPASIPLPPTFGTADDDAPAS